MYTLVQLHTKVLGLPVYGMKLLQVLYERACVRSEARCAAGISVQEDSRERTPAAGWAPFISTKIFVKKEQTIHASFFLFRKTDHTSAIPS